MLHLLLIINFTLYTCRLEAQAYFVGKIQLHLHCVASVATLKLYTGAVLFGSHTNSTSTVAFRVEEAPAPEHKPLGAWAFAMVIVTPVPLGAHFGCMVGSSFGATQFARMAQPPLGSL